jgi:hypothetical protein
MNCQTGTGPETEGQAHPYPWGAQTLPVFHPLHWLHVIYQPDPGCPETDAAPSTDALFHSGVPTPSTS